MLQKKLENISRPWKKIQNLINVGPMFIPDYRALGKNGCFPE